jgi:YfiH family protein
MIIDSALLKRYDGIRFGMSTRRGGISPEPLGMNLSFRVGDDPANVAENRRRLFTALGMDLSRIAVPFQCHSDLIKVVSKPGEYESCDALVTEALDLPLAVSVADCMAIVIYDPVQRVMAIAHAGWRGTAKTIVTKALALMKENYSVSAKEVVAYLSPSAGQCCYEVGPEVAEKFENEYVVERDQRLYLDLRKANTDQLLAAGLLKGNIEISQRCTVCNPELFHSFRRDGQRAGRMMAVACLVEGNNK